MLVLLLGCGDPLFGGESLDGLLGVQAPPQQPAWEMRWFDGDQLVVDCDLVPSEPVLAEEALFGELFVPTPFEPPPLEWLDPDDTLAVGVAVLVDENAYTPFGGYPDSDFEDDFEELDDEELELSVEERLGDALASDVERGVWGVDLWQVVVVVRPGGEALAQELIIGDFAEELEPGTYWLGFVPELTWFTGSLVDTVFLLDDDEEGYEWLYVASLGILEPVPIEVYTGESLGGVLPGASCE